MGKLNDLLSKIIAKLNTSVKTEVQSFTEKEKAQARENIGAISYEDPTIIKDSINGYRYLIEMRNGNIVSSPLVASIRIAVPPTKLEYEEGVDSNIDVTGMIVEAVYEDGSSEVIEDYSCSDSFDDMVDGMLKVSYKQLNMEFSDYVPVTVIRLIPCTGIELTTDWTGTELDSSTNPKETMTLTAIVTPENTTDEVIWTSSDTSVATVENGVVTGVHMYISGHPQSANATITATCGGFSANYDICVRWDDLPMTPIG